MSKNPRLNWDQLLDGQEYVLDLDEIHWHTGLSDLRAKVHYEVDKRRGIARTNKVSPTQLRIRAEGARVRVAAGTDGPCNCGASRRPWDFHVVTCSSLGANAATLIGGGTYAQAMTPRRPVQPAPQAPAVSTLEPSDEEDAEALLGPCTCGQDPACLPSCARYT